MNIKVGSVNFEFNQVSSEMRHASKYDENHHCLETITDGPLNKKIKTTYTYDNKGRLIESTSFTLDDGYDGKVKMRATAQPSMTTKIEYDDKDRIILIEYLGIKNPSDIKQTVHKYKESKFGTIITTTNSTNDGSMSIVRSYDGSEQPFEIINYDKDGKFIDHTIRNKLFQVEGSENIIGKSYHSTRDNEWADLTISTYEYDKVSKKHWLTSQIDAKTPRIDAEYIFGDTGLILPDATSIQPEDIISTSTRAYISDPEYGFCQDTTEDHYTSSHGEKVKSVTKYSYNGGIQDGAKITIYMNGSDNGYNAEVKYTNNGKFFIYEQGSKIFTISTSPMYDADIILEPNQSKYLAQGFIDETGHFMITIDDMMDEKDFHYSYRNGDISLHYKTRNSLYRVYSQKVKNQSNNFITITKLEVAKFNKNDKISDDIFVIVEEDTVVRDLINYLLKLSKENVEVENMKLIMNNLIK